VRLEYDFADSPGHWIWLTSRIWQRAVNDELKQHGLTMRQLQLLAWLAYEGDLTQAELADHRRHTRSHATRRLDCPLSRSRRSAEKCRPAHASSRADLECHGPLSPPCQAAGGYRHFTGRTRAASQPACPYPGEPASDGKVRRSCRPGARQRRSPCFQGVNQRLGHKISASHHRALPIRRGRLSCRERFSGSSWR
jgi:hypothetical protein